MRTFEELKGETEDTHDDELDRVISWLSRVKSLLKQADGEFLSTALAFGTAFRRLKKPPGERTRCRWTDRYLEVLITTPTERTYPISEKLAKQVFGPVFQEFHELPIYHVWSLERLRAERESKSRFWRSLKNEAVLLAGEPLD